MSNKIKVDLGNNSYNISLIEGFKNSVVKFASSTKSQCMLITQKEILNLYKDEINELSNLPNVNIFLIDQGEKAKSFESISLIVNEMAKKHFDRSSLVFAVGGGVVGDVAGFASSIFMRGIKYIQYPTTLLAMVDSAIGGKTGINLKDGKNLVGRIYQPIAVEIDTNFLSTLPDRELQAALAEVVKYGFIYDREFFDYYRNDGAELFTSISNIINFFNGFFSLNLKNEEIANTNNNIINTLVNFKLTTISNYLETTYCLTFKM